MTGASINLTHLDGKKLKIVNKPGDVIKPDDIKTVDGLGMPFHKQTYKTGNLFLLFKVKFPDNLKNEDVNQIRTALEI